MSQSKFQKSKIYSEVTQSLDAALTRLSQIWDDIGIMAEERSKRSKVVMLHVGNLLEEMVNEEASLKKRLLANVDRYGKELMALCQELSLPIYEPDDNTSILLLEKELRTRVDVLSKEKHARVKQLRQLKDQDQHLCDVLCATPYYVPSGAVPSDQQLTELKQHITSLEQEKDKRHNQFKTMKATIVKLLDDLDQSPDTSLAVNVVCDEEESFLLSTERLKHMKVYQDELENQQKANFAEAADLRDRLNTLWDRLKVTAEDRTAFITNHTGFKPKVIQALKEETSRCELEKLQNIQSVIEETRVELKEWWDKCFYSQTQRDEFRDIRSDDFTEELLESHDLEVKNMKAHYTENKDLYEKIAKRQVLWGEYLEFERKASDPKRLFNRGWNALKEEKNRKRIMKELPKTESEVKEAIASWEVNNSREFLISGERFEDFISRQWQDNKQQKEDEKHQRQKAKTKELQEEMQYGSKPVTPAKRRFATPAKSPGNSTKLRKMNDTQKTPGMSRLGRTQTSLFMSPTGITPKRRPMTRASVTRQALTDRNHSSVHNQQHSRHMRSTAKKMINDTTLFSHTTVSSSAASQHSIADASLASLGQYNEFAVSTHVNSTRNSQTTVARNVSSRGNASRSSVRNHSRTKPHQSRSQNTVSSISSNGSVSNVSNTFARSLTNNSTTNSSVGNVIHMGRF